MATQDFYDNIIAMGQDPNMLNQAAFAPVQVPQEEEEEERGEFYKGLLRGTDQSQAMLYGAAMLLGKATDSDTIKDWGLEGYKRNMEEAAQNAAAVSTIEEIDSLETASDWFFGSLGELAPTMAETVIAAVAGGGLGGIAGRSMAKKAIKESVEALVKKGVAKEVAEQEVKKSIGKKVGSQLGMHGFVWALESGGMFAEDVEERGFQEANPVSASMFGAMASAAEAVGASGQLVRRVFGEAGEKAAKEAIKTGNKSALKQLGLGVMNGMLGEAGTEGFQEMMGILNSRYTGGRELTATPSDEEWSQVINAAAKGAAGGGGVGLVTGAYASRKENAIREQAALSTARDEQEVLANEMKELTKQQNIAAINGDWNAHESILAQKKALGQTMEQQDVKVQAEDNISEEIKNDILSNTTVGLEEDAPITKTEAIEKLQNERKNLSRKSSAMTQESIFSPDLDTNTKMEKQKEVADLNHQVANIDAILENVGKYGEVIPENDGNAVFGFQPTPAQRNAVDTKNKNIEARQKEIENLQKARQAKAVEVEQAIVQEEVALTQQKEEADKANRRSRQKGKRKKIIGEKQAARDEAVVEERIAEEEAAEEKTILQQLKDEEDSLANEQFIAETRMAEEQAAFDSLLAEEQAVEEREKAIQQFEEDLIAPERTRGFQPTPVIQDATAGTLADQAPSIPIDDTRAPLVDDTPTPSPIVDQTGAPIDTVTPDLDLVTPEGKPLLSRAERTTLEAKRQTKPKKKLPKKKPKKKIKIERTSARPKKKQKTPTVVYTKSGKPFKSKQSAENTIAKMGKKDSFIADKTSEGWGIRPMNRLEKQLNQKAKEESTKPKKKMPPKKKKKKSKSVKPRDTAKDGVVTKEESVQRFAEVKGIADPIIKNIKSVSDGRVKFNIIRNVEDLKNGTEKEQALYKEVKEYKSEDSRGLYYDGEVYLVSDNITGGEQNIQNIITHEMRHFSLSELMNKDINSLLQSYANANKQMLEERINNYGYDVTEDILLEEAEEDLVNSYLNNTLEPTWKEKLEAVVRKYLRKIFKGMEVTNAEIKVLLQKVDQNYKQREANQSGRKSKFRAARSAAFKEASSLVGNKMYEIETAKDLANLVKSRGTSGAIMRQIFDHTFDLKKVSDTLHQKRRLLAGASSIADYSLVEGNLVWNKDTGWVELEDPTKSNGPLKALESLGDYKDVFMMWMQSESIKEIKNTRKVNKDFYGPEGTDDKVHAAVDAEASRAMEVIGKEKWMGVARIFNDFTESKLNLAAESGIVDPKLAENWKRSVYIPLYREIEERMADDPSNLNPKDFQTMLRDGVEKIGKGKVGKLADPLESFVHNYKLMVENSMRNQVWTESVDTMKGMKLAKRVKNFKPKSNIMGIMKNGKTEYYMIEDTNLFEALQELPAPMRGLVGKLFTKSKSFFTQAITFTPVFRVRNFLRDTLHSWILMGDKVGFLEAFSDAGKAYIDIMQNHPDFKTLMSQGGAFAQYDLDGTITAKSLTSKPFGKVTNSSLWKWWNDIGRAAENANRLAMYRRLKAEGATDVESAYQARDIMDFSSSGKAGAVKAMMMMIPFFNAKLQGWSKISRELNNPKRSKAAILGRGLVLSLAALTLGMLNQDEEEWKNMPDFDKFSSAHAWVGGYHMRIPLPFEMGILYTAPMALMEVANNNRDTRFLGNLLGHFLAENAGFNVIPQLLKPALEDAINKDMFKDRAIVSAWEKGIDPKLQFTPWTSHSVKMLAQSMPESAPDFLKSPKRLQHLLDGYGSTFSKFTYGVTDALMEVSGMVPERAAMDWEESILDWTSLNRLFTKEKSYRTFKEKEVYENLEDIMEKANTFAELKSRREIGKARGFLQQNRNSLKMAKYYRAWQRKLKALNTKARIIERNKKLSAEEKYRMEQKLQAERARIFAAIYDRMVKDGNFKTSGGE